MVHYTFIFLYTYNTLFCEIRPRLNNWKGTEGEDKTHKNKVCLYASDFQFSRVLKVQRAYNTPGFYMPAFQMLSLVLFHKKEVIYNNGNR